MSWIYNIVVEFSAMVCYRVYNSQEIYFWFSLFLVLYFH